MYQRLCSVISKILLMIYYLMTKIMRTITAKKKTNGTDSLNYLRYICNKTTDIEDINVLIHLAYC